MVDHAIESVSETADPEEEEEALVKEVEQHSDSEESGDHQEKDVKLVTEKPAPSEEVATSGEDDEITDAD